MNNAADITLQEAFCAAFCPTRCLLRKSPQSTSKPIWHTWIQRSFLLLYSGRVEHQLIWFDFSIMAILCDAAVSSHSPKT